MIPVFAVPILNRGDLLTRLFQSIDYPVYRFVIINNGTNPSVDLAINRILKKHSNVDVIRPGGNIGVAASWNLVTQQYPAPYHFICSNDIQFQRGDMARMAQAAKNPEEAIIVGNFGFAYFIVTKKGMETVGTFDENFYPAYYEDCDWMRRARLLGFEHTIVQGMTAIHGEAPHWGSATIHSNKHYQQKNGITGNQNSIYFERKWGGPPAKEVFPTPFNDPDWPPAKWVLEPERFEQLHVW